MKVNIALDLTEHELRKVRAGIDRSGLATRKEVRIFADRAIRDALSRLPDPKPGRRKPSTSPSPSPTVEDAPDTPCTHCTQPKSAHSLYGTCPLSKSYGKGTKFKAVSA